MSEEENKALVRRFFEARVKTDLDALGQDASSRLPQPH
jgi:hypothetical protein